MEIRSFGENAAPKLLDERNIEGYAIVFERESRVMYDLEKKRFLKSLSRVLFPKNYSVVVMLRHY